MSWGQVIFLCCVFYLRSSGCCWAQLSKQTTQTIPIKGAQLIRVAIPNAEVYFKETKGYRLIVEANIELSVPNETLLNFVINNGRYQVEWTINPNNKELLITAQRDRDLLVVRGEICQEKVVYVIYVPKKLRHRP